MTPDVACARAQLLQLAARHCSHAAAARRATSSALTQSRRASSASRTTAASPSLSAVKRGRGAAEGAGDAGAEAAFWSLQGKKLGESDADSGNLADALAAAATLTDSLEAVAAELRDRWRAAAAGKWAGNKPSLTPGACTAYAYLEPRLRAVDAAHYAAAGVLPYCADPAVVAHAAALAAAQALLHAASPAEPPPALAPPSITARSLASTAVLLARQGPEKWKRMHAGRLLLLGGKREEADSGPLATALREAREETAGLLGGLGAGRRGGGPSHYRRADAAELLGPVLWIPQGRFALFLLPLPPRHLTELPEAFAARVSSGAGSGAEVDNLEWVPLPEVLASEKAQARLVAKYARQVLTSQQLLRFFLALAQKKQQSADIAR